MTTTRATPVRLTQFAHGGGCACKIPPGELEDVLTGLTATTSAVGAPLLVGLATGDDAAVGIERHDGEADGVVATIGSADIRESAGIAVHRRGHDPVAPGARLAVPRAR